MCRSGVPHPENESDDRCLHEHRTDSGDDPAGPHDRGGWFELLGLAVDHDRTDSDRGYACDERERCPLLYPVRVHQHPLCQIGV